MGTSGVWADDGTLVTWDFTNSSCAAGQANIGTGTGTVASDVSGVELTVTIGSGGKFNSKDRSSDIQINATVAIQIPVKTTKDVITITNYGGSWGIGYTIGTEEVAKTEDSKTYTATAADVTAGYATMTVTTSGYAKKITVLQYEPVEPQPSGTSYTFGIGQTDPTETGSAIATTGTLPTDVTTSITSTSTGGSSSTRTVSNGTEKITVVTSAATSNKLSGTAQNAFSDAFYFGYDVVIPNGKVLNISQIAGNLYPANDRNAAYKIAVYKGETKLYESTATSFTANSISETDVKLTTTSETALQNLTGTISVRMPWWQAGSSSYVALKDLNITATLEDAGATAPTVSIPASAEAITNADVEIKATIKSIPEYTGIQWYSCDDAQGTNPTAVEGATSATYTVNKSATGTYYYYCSVTNAVGTTNSNVCTVTVADKAEFKNFSLILNNETGTLLTAAELVQGTAFEFGVKVADDGTVSRVTKDSPSAVAVVSGQYWNDHGSQSVKVVATVPGNIKYTIGDCTYGSHTATISDGNTTQNVTTTAACWKGKHEATTIAYYENTSATDVTLTFTGASYTPYIAMEKIEEVPTLCAVKFYNGETLVSTVEAYKGTAIGTLLANPTVEAGNHFHGWYENADGTGAKALTSTAVNEDMTFYASILPYTTNSDGTLSPVNTGTDLQNGASLMSLVEYCGENASDNVQKIYVPNGTYDFGTACRTELKKNIAVLGESRVGVKIVNHPTAPGIQATSTFRITGDNVYIQNVTLRCDVSYPDSKTSGVGVALEINGNKSICNNVDLQCNQDTYYSNVNDAYVGYFKGGRIEGTVDFICGGGNMWFEGTTLYNNDRTLADVIGAPATGTGSTYGYVLNNCTIDGADSQAGNYNLARGWQNSPAMTWLNTTFAKMPSTKGYTNMSDNLVCRFHEYLSKDASGNEVTGHSLEGLGYSSSSDAIYLTTEQAAKYTYANVFGDWDPEAIIASYNKVKANMQITEAGCATFCAPFDVDIPAGVKAYTADAVVDNNWIKMTEVTGTIPAGTPVVIYGAACTHEFEAKPTATTAKYGVLTGNIGSDKAEVANGKYLLQRNNEVTGWYQVTTTGLNIGVNRCYMSFTPSTPSYEAKSCYLMGFDGVAPTAINNVVAAQAASKKDGKYLVNGQLVVVKAGKAYNAAGAVIK